MDNIENTGTPVGSDGATSSPDNASPVDTQTVATEPAVSDGGQEPAAGQATNPWDTDPRFKGKSPEEVFKSYTELEGKLGSLGQKAAVADLIQEQYGVTPEQLRVQIEQQKIAEQRQRYAENPLAPVLDEVQQLRAWKEQQEQEKALAATKSEVDSFIKANPGYEAHKDKLLKLTLTPGIGFDPTTGQETDISEIASEYFGAARAQGQQDAYKKIETKVSTQATGGSKAPARGKPTPEELRSMSYEERLAVLPHGPNS